MQISTNAGQNRGRVWCAPKRALAGGWPNRLGVRGEGGWACIDHSTIDRRSKGRPEKGRAPRPTPRVPFEFSPGEKQGTRSPRVGVNVPKSEAVPASSERPRPCCALRERPRRAEHVRHKGGFAQIGPHYEVVSGRVQVGFELAASRVADILAAAENRVGEAELRGQAGRGGGRSSAGRDKRQRKQETATSVAPSALQVWVRSKTRRTPAPLKGRHSTVYSPKDPAWNLRCPLVNRHQVRASSRPRGLGAAFPAGGRLPRPSRRVISRAKTDALSMGRLVRGPPSR